RDAGVRRGPVLEYLLRAARPLSVKRVAVPATRAISVKRLHGAAQRSIATTVWVEDLLVHCSPTRLEERARALRLAGAAGAVTGSVMGAGAGAPVEAVGAAVPMVTCTLLDGAESALKPCATTR